MGKGGKWGDEKGYRGKPGDEVWGKGKFGDDKGGKGKYADDKGGKGKVHPWSYADAVHQQQDVKGARRKGGRGGGSDSEGGGTSAGKGKAKWVVRSSAPAEESQEAAAGVPHSGSGAKATTYKHDFRKYDRSQFDEVSKELHSETLVAPESVAALSSEIPIFRELPTLELAAAG